MSTTFTQSVTPAVSAPAGATVIDADDPRVVNGHIAPGTFADASGDIVLGAGITDIGDRAFAFSSVTSVSAPHGLRSIGDDAFRGCRRLKAVSFASVDWIGSVAFGGCQSLKDATFAYHGASGNGPLRIGHDAFLGCTCLKHVTVPARLDALGDRAFDGCEDLEGIDTVNGTPHIVSGAIGDNAFRGCERLTEAFIPEGTAFIGSGAFENCTGMTHARIPAAVTTIPNNAFAGCTSLEHVSAHDGITAIGDRAFVNTWRLDVNLPARLVTIGNQAFERCGIRTVDLPASVRRIGDDAFHACHAKSVTFHAAPADGVDHGAFMGCKRLTNVTLPDGMQYIADGMFAGCTSLDSVTIPDTVTVISNSAFFDCLNLKHVTLPKGLASIGWRAFMMTGVAHVVIPNGTTHIGRTAFGNGGRLGSVVLPSSSGNGLDRQPIGNASDTGTASFTIPFDMMGADTNDRHTAVIRSVRNRASQDHLRVRLHHRRVAWIR